MKPSQLTERILGDDAFRALQRLGGTLGIDGLDPELVLVARGQVVDLDLWLVGAAGRHPDTGLRVELFHLEVVNRGAAVIFRRVPLDLTAVLVHIWPIAESKT